jgi:hypothetical protein
VAAAALGWLKLTVPPAPIENEFQLMMALFEDWLTFSVPFDGAAILAAPWVTAPPPGSVCASAMLPLNTTQPNTSGAKAALTLPRIGVTSYVCVMPSSCHLHGRR